MKVLLTVTPRVQAPPPLAPISKRKPLVGRNHTSGLVVNVGAYMVTQFQDGTTLIRSTAKSGHVNAHGVSIRFKSGDFGTAASTSMPAPSISGDSALTMTFSGDTSSTSSSRIRPKENQSGLPVGSKAVIGIKVGAAVLQ
ncbi:uncharacterized protein RCO7_14304 [Rhynchosporium graminicola]|uniref:Uncharacterized protein n=1 Tax=Rhynchosporium graminicola TaxID=2792576 RepID=A0A1E1K7B1_9HELO|nr:uncharacterized protein RCO7_14304 [Rhynchosporium commune]